MFWSVQVCRTLMEENETNMNGQNFYNLYKPLSSYFLDAVEKIETFLCFP